MELPEDKLADFIQENDKLAEWKVAINHNIRNFTEDEIRRITNNYSTRIGQGGFGEVYKGVFDDDHGLVAVKRYIRSELIEEFMDEVSIHSQINHKNAVKLIGYCIGESTLTMVTEYISKGNLDDTLHNSDISIPLDIRLGIAVGCAEALSYMHSMHLSIDSLVCHGDIKPANILLDENLTAKVSDFGLSRLLSGGITQYTRNVKGSIDYMDPIYLQEGRLTPKSDVYSFGVVLLELIARKRAKDQGNLSLISTFSKACKKGKGLRQLFDAEIANMTNMKILEEIGKLATECLTRDIHKRPRMNDVVQRLLRLWKLLRGGQENKGWGLFWRAQNVGTSSFSSTSSVVHRRKEISDIFETEDVDPEIIAKLGNMRIFTEGELNEITKGYSYLLGEGWFDYVYKGTLEDNTVVAVQRSLKANESHRHYLVNEAMVHAQVAHKNIIKLLGFCLDPEIPIFLYEFAAKGSLSDLLNGNEHFPLESRLNIAIMTAEALAYMHSPESGVIRHGSVRPSNIYLDENFMPKVSGFSLSRRLSGFSLSRRLTKDYEYTHTVLADGCYIDPNYWRTGLLSVKSDVYSFGIVLMELISRISRYNDYRMLADLVNKYNQAYESDGSGVAVFDKDIMAAAENIILLEGMGRLAMECTKLEVDERPTMKVVAQRLKMLRRYLEEELIKCGPEGMPQ